jgi:signal transduction histidine kinase
MITAVSHEVRTPLTSVLGIARTLQRFDDRIDADERRDLIQRLVGGGDRLQHLLSDLLDVDRFADGEIRPGNVTIDIARTVRKAAVRYADHGEVFVETQSASVSIDPVMFERLLDILISNAVIHTPPGTQLWVTVKAGMSSVLLSVEDDGPGIAPELIESLFTPLQYRPNADSASPGLGIGLAIAAQLATLHGGRIWFERRAGGGARFFVELPSADPHRDASDNKPLARRADEVEAS